MTVDYEDRKAITRAVADAYGLHAQELHRGTRRRFISEARHMAITLLYERGLTLLQCARYFGLGSHTTAWYAREATYGRMKGDPNVRAVYKRLGGLRA